jgi:leader peptidase (prepilin peptidase)/N-methyltransferase
VYTGDDLLAADLPAWLVRIMSFVFGALWGSFFNVAIYRWPRGMSVVTPPSHCPACGAPVRWYLNVPIVGYALLKGRARCCGAKLTPRYVWVEFITAVLSLAVAERFFVRASDGTTFHQGLLDTLLYFTYVGGLLIATFVDLEWMEIPDEVSLPGAALGLATVGLRTGPDALNAAVGAGVGFLIVYFLFTRLWELVRGARGMGEGDAKLLLMIGAFSGWECILFCLAAGSLQGLVLAGVAKIAGIPGIPNPPDDQVVAQASLAGLKIVTPDEVVSNQAPGDEAATPDACQPDAPAEGERNLPKMVFGPVLALSALEYLFFSDPILAWVHFR